ncbi:hypothetical protein KIN20_010099 [Parelaphostrongylus tenuis]|uniref:Uncharacterized protein n=1 Tax=Parelaphostrongylus tenuis TaxID=148309 RepID=A0AAD5MC24_PARTN|nr:hypothetical protein KIN20_010099 [Parelaphostrongylus tenuis]
MVGRGKHPEDLFLLFQYPTDHVKVIIRGAYLGDFQTHACHNSTAKLTITK